MHSVLPVRMNFDQILIRMQKEHLLHKSNPDATVSKLNCWKNLQKNSKKTLNKIKKTLKNL